MRKLVFLSLLLYAAVGWAQMTESAQTFIQQQVRLRTDSDSVRIINRDPWNLQLYLGINKSGNENLPWTEISTYPWAFGAFFAIAKEFTPLWGARLAFRFNHNKSRNVQECEDRQPYGWRNVALFADATFDITDLVHGQKAQWKYYERRRYYDESDGRYHEDEEKRYRTSKFNLKAFAGIGLAYTWHFDSIPLSYTHPYSRSSKLLPAVRAGLTATWRLTDNWRIGAELSHTMFEDHFNGVAHGFPLDGRTNLKVGLTYLFLRSPKAPRMPIIRRNRLKVCPPLPLIMPAPEQNKLRQIQGHAFLDFPVNETIIYPKYRRNPEELAKLNASVDSALFDKSVVIKRISLHGYASPESPYSNNVRLAKGRTAEIKSYLKRKYHFSEELFTTDYTPEDWQNLRGFLTNMEGRKVKGDFWYDSKPYVETPEAPAMLRDYLDELLSVIDADMEPDAKEEKLKKVGGGEPYRWLHRHVYPGLRHTDYIIDYEVKAYKPKDGRRLIYTHPEALSLEEMYLVAQCYEERSDSWLDALLIAAKQYPDDPTANYNAACGCAMTNRLVDAKRYLQKAGNSSQAQYVYSVIKAMEGYTYEE